MSVTFVQDSTVKLVKTNASDIDVARAAWVSFDYEADEREADPERVKGLINFLMREGHTSPFEHGSFTFMIDTPIFVAREFMRHRTWSYNEVSGRYKEMEPRFYVPSMTRPVVQHGKAGAYQFDEDARLAGRASARIADANMFAWDHYQEMLQNGIAKEVARMALPVNLMTTFYATANPLNVLKFMKQRTSGQALYEIRQVANQIENIFIDTMPYTYRAYADHWFN